MSDWYEWQQAPAGSYAVIGDPVSHSLSPKMHRAIYRELGLKESYEAIRVPLADFDLAMERLTEIGYKGLNITLPLKFKALDWCRSTDSERYGSINTLRLDDRAGANTDAPGFLATLSGLELKNKQVLVLGAGGSAFALVRALSESGFKVKVYNRTTEKALRLASAIPGVEVTLEPNLEGFGMVLNTTSAGITGEKLPLDWSRANDDCVAYDLFYSADLTPFLIDPASQGLKVLDGKAMLIEQGALSFEWWTGRKAQRSAMYEAIQ